MNLTKFVVNPFTEDAYFDEAAYAEAVRIFTRMLDNVVEINGLPLPEQEAEIRLKRRHGMGFLGLGSAMAMLGIKYGSKKSLEMTERVSYLMALNGYQTGVKLAKEKGAAPIMDQDFPLVRHNGVYTLDLTLGKNYKGRELMARSQYMQKFQTTREGAELLAQIEKHGCRFTHAVSIAPTGTISLSVANNVSNGIEPSFAHHYYRNVIEDGKNAKTRVSVFSYELLAYRQWRVNQGMEVPEDDAELLNMMPESFVSTDDLHPNEHVDIQAAAQRWVDSSISKTTNVPTDYPFEDFKDIYQYAAEQGLKGCTTFRFNPAAFQGVLVKQADLQNTKYEFALEDGTRITALGTDMIEYQGEVVSAGNLFDALKEGYWGKFNTQGGKDTA